MNRCRDRQTRRAWSLWILRVIGRCTDAERIYIGRHLPRLPQIKELVLFTDFGQPIDPSPDRADAAIWALTALLDDRRSRIAVVGGPVILGGTKKAPAARSTGWPPPGRAFVRPLS